ncbi:MAG: sigma-70 family RNA polymerase sigma factor [Pseudomonadota bacterium]
MNMLTSARLGQEKRASTPDVSYGVVAKLTTRADTFAQKDADVNVQERVSAAPWVAEIEAIRLHQDQAAFAALFQHFAPRVKAFLMKSGANAALAEETTQEVMATLWTKAHMFDPARASAATWIFTIARNRSIDAIRKQRRPEPEDLPWGPEAEPDQEDALALQQESSQLARALSELPEKQRVLIERAYFGDLSHSEIAAETGLPLGTIKSRIRLALDRLRHAMK